MTGKGFITEAVNAVTRYAFQVLGARRVEIRCDSENTKSANVPHRLGYELEGKFRNDNLKCHNKGTRDTLVFSRVDLNELPPLDVEWGTSILSSELPQIETERALLRLPTVGDVQKIIEFYRSNETHLGRWNPTCPPDFFTEKYWRSKILSWHKEFSDDRSVRFFIFGGSRKDEIIGSVAFTDIIRGPLQACFLGYALSKESEGKGLMTEALKSAIQYIFKHKNIHRITAGYLPENSRSAHVLQRLGFTQECHAPDYLRINDQWRDNIITSLTNRNWAPLSPNPNFKPSYHHDYR
jgi:ribosomal-protein-alanine N-acetyltransferase